MTLELFRPYRARVRGGGTVPCSMAHAMGWHVGKLCRPFRARVRGWAAAVLPHGLRHGLTCSLVHGLRDGLTCSLSLTAGEGCFNM